MTVDKEHSQTEHLLSGVPITTKDSAKTIRLSAADGSTATSAQVSLCCTLPLAFLQQKTYCPAGWVSGSPLTIQLEIAELGAWLTSKAGTGAIGTPTFTVSNIEFMAQTVTFDADINSTYASLLETVGGVQSHGVTYLNAMTQPIAAVASATNQSSLYNFQVPVRVRSMRALITAMYDQSTTKSITAHSITNRVARRLSTFQASIGGIKYPTSAVKIAHNDQGEAFAEVKKVASSVTSRHSAGMMRAADGVSSARNGSEMADAYYPQVDEDRFCSFFQTLSFKSYLNDAAQHEDGLNMSSQTSNVQQELRLIPATTATEVATWCACDIVFTYLSSGVVASSL